MVDWHRFTPANFEYDFEGDELATHHVTFDEAIECFFSDFEIRRNKSFRDRYQLIGRTIGGTKTKNHFSTHARERCSNYNRMVNMSTEVKPNKDLSEKEIDEILVAQADDESAWEKPIYVHRTKPASLSMPAELAARAAFLARLHRKKSFEEWLRLIIQERVELEEAAFVGMKHDLSLKAG